MSFLNFIRTTTVDSGDALYIGHDLYLKVLSGGDATEDIERWINADKMYIEHIRREQDPLQAAFFPTQKIPTMRGELSFSLSKGIHILADTLKKENANIGEAYTAWLDKSSPVYSQPHSRHLLPIQTRVPHMASKRNDGGEFVIGCGSSFIETPFSTYYQTPEEIAVSGLNVYLEFLEVFKHFNSVMEWVNKDDAVMAWTHENIRWNVSGGFYELNFFHFDDFVTTPLYPNCPEHRSDNMLQQKDRAANTIVSNVVKFEEQYTRALINKISGK